MQFHRFLAIKTRLIKNKTIILIKVLHMLT